MTDPFEQARARARKAAGRTKPNFLRDKNGLIIACPENARIALQRLDLRPRRNLFTGERVVEHSDGARVPLTDEIEIAARYDTERDCGWLPERTLISEVIVDLAERDTYHPVRDYLDGLKWDGQPRLDGWLTTYAGADDTPYTRAVGTLTLTAAVRRVRQPGCKFDELPLLVSPQGMEKSTLIKVLAVHEDWYSDSLPIGADAKITVERTRGTWIAELADLAGKNRRDVEAVKAMLSRATDGPVRLSYARNSVTVPRQFICVGTSNLDQPLHDATGNRRFWPLETRQIDLKALRRDRDQLWAESAAVEAQEDHSIRLDRSLWPAATEAQESFRGAHPWEDTLREWLGDQTGKIHAETVWQIVDRVAVGTRSQADRDIIGRAMRAIGFQARQLRFEGQRAFGYVRGAGLARERIITEREAKKTKGNRSAPHGPAEVLPFKGEE